jgi:flagellar motor switch protein FliN
MNQVKSIAHSGKVRSVAAVAAGLGNALAEVTGSRPAIRKIASEAKDAAKDAHTDMLWWRCSAPPEMSIGISEADAAILLGMRERNLPGEPPDPVRANLSDVLERAWGSGEMAAQSPADPHSLDVFKTEFPSGGSVRFFVAQSNPAPAAGDIDADSNLSMLLDIELPVTLRFGSAQMALRDIAGLTTGSVIEFDRGVDDPVEVMVDGRVVARGEAVTVQGCYGVRISEVSSRRERLATSPFAAVGDGREIAGEEIV